MTTKQLYYLVTIADLGSLSGAAQALGISQPALSKFLTEYEDSLGFLLFLRYRRQLLPTAVGRYVITCAQKILDEQTRMLQSIRAVTDTNHTLIRLATAPNRGAIIYSRIYNSFSRRYPDISLSLTELYASEQPGAISHGQIDLAIGSGMVSEKVTDLPFAQEELLVSLPASHPMASQKSIRLADLKDTPFVLQGPRHSIRILAEKLFEKAGFSPVVTFESNDVILVDSMLHQAVGAGLVSQAHVFPCEELVYRPLNPPVYQTLHIRYPIGHTLTEPERYLAGLLIRERLSDPRYHAVPCPEAEELLRFADSTSDTEENGISAPTQFSLHTRTAHNTAPQISLNTDLLRYLIAIVDEKSLSKAAERFYLPQPALSRHLRNAETMLCTQLFTRIHNRLQPTNAGKVFVNFARNMLQIDAEMHQRIRDYRQGHGNHIQIQCDPAAAPVIRRQINDAFCALHPDIRLSITEGSREETQEALLNASADIGIYFSCQDEHSILDSRILAESRLVYCASLGESLPEARTLPLQKHLSPSRLMLAPEGSALRAEQDRLFSLIAEQQAETACQASEDILHLLAACGAASTILPEHSVPLEARTRCRPFADPQHYYLLLVIHPGRTLPPAFQDLFQLLYDGLETWFGSGH